MVPQGETAWRLGLSIVEMDDWDFLDLVEEPHLGFNDAGMASATDFFNSLPIGNK